MTLPMTTLRVLKRCALRELRPRISCIAADPHALRSGWINGSQTSFHAALCPLFSGVCRISAFRPERKARGITEKLKCRTCSRGREASGVL